MPNSLLELIHCDTDRPVGCRAGNAVGRAEFLTRVGNWYALLQLQTGTQFALYLDDSIEFAAALFGAWHAGKTVWISADTLPASIDALQSKVDGFLGEFPAACQPQQPSITAAPEQTLPALHPDFVGLVVHTSGTTGKASAIAKKLSQLASEVATLEQLFGVQVGDADIMATVSHQHIYGLLFKVLWPLSAGRMFDAETVQYPEELVDRLPGSVLISSPAHIKRFPSHLNWPRSHLIFCSGGVLPVDAAMACAAMVGSAPMEVYGSSETGGIAYRQRASAGDDAWQAMPGVQWRIAENQLIEVRSSHLFDDNWLTLSDRGEATADEKFILKGRSDRIVKIEEKRISLDALERALLASPLISEARLIVIEAQRQHLAAVLVPSEAGRHYLQQHGKLALNRELKTALQTVAEAVAVPRRWRYVDALPHNAQGKTTEAMLQELFLEPGATATLTAPLFTLPASDPHHAELDVCWPAQLHYFIGHFDDTPVLPGVAQVHWAAQIGRTLFNIALPFKAIHALKFQHVVLPDNVTRLTLDYDPVKVSLNFAFTSADRRHSSGRILFHCGSAHD